MMTIDILDGGPGPKRGDLIQSNVGGRRERTWLVIRSHHMRRARAPHRYRVLAARWWELEPEIRVQLFRSAQRNGGQQVFFFKRYPVKKRKKTMEEYVTVGG
jgi:hypothetical protein